MLGDVNSVRRAGRPGRPRLGLAMASTEVRRNDDPLGRRRRIGPSRANIKDPKSDAVGPLVVQIRDERAAAAVGNSCSAPWTRAFAGAVFIGSGATNVSNGSRSRPSRGGSRWLDPATSCRPRAAAFRSPSAISRKTSDSSTFRRRARMTTCRCRLPRALEEWGESRLRLPQSLAERDQLREASAIHRHGLGKMLSTTPACERWTCWTP